MNYTQKIEKAIQTACRLHNKQTRKVDNTLPYVSHLFSTAVIVSNYSKDEDVVIAALLHDSVEDAGYTFEQIAQDFGEKVSEIIKGTTEEKYGGSTKENWYKRKSEYLNNLKLVSRESLIVSAADKIHNMICDMNQVLVLKQHHDSLFNSTIDQKVWYLTEVYNILKTRLKNNIVGLYKSTLDEYIETFKT